MSERRPRYRGSLFFPLLLIALGLLFLLNNFGVLTGNIWDFVATFWPLLLIVWGLDAGLRRNGIVGPALLIGVGVVFQLSNLGYLALDVWIAIIRLWPVLLVAIGLDIVIGHRRSPWWSLLGLVLVLALLGGALLAYGITVNQGQALSSEQVSQPLQDANQAKVVIEPAVGSILIDTLSGSDLLVSGNIRLGNVGKVSQSYSVTGTRGSYTLRRTGASFVGSPFVSPGEWGWELGLSGAVPIDLKVSMGAGNTDLDLSGLNLSGLEVDMGVGKTTLTLPKSGRFQGKVDSAIGQIEIVVPRGAAVRVKADTGLAVTNVPQDFINNGDFYASPAYATATSRIDLDASQAIGNILVRYATGN